MHALLGSVIASLVPGDFFQFIYRVIFKVIAKWFPGVNQIDQRDPVNWLSTPKTFFTHIAFLRTRNKRPTESVTRSPYFWNYHRSPKPKASRVRAMLGSVDGGAPTLPYTTRHTCNIPSDTQNPNEYHCRDNYTYLEVVFCAYCLPNG